MDANFQAPAQALILSAAYTGILLHILPVSRGPTADGLQFSLIRGLHIPLPCLRGSFRKQKDWENVGGNVCICTPICVCVCTHANTYTERKRNTFLIVFSNRNKRESFHFSLWMQFCFLMQGQHLPAILESTLSAIHTYLTDMK